MMLELLRWLDKKVEFGSFVDNVLSESKMLKVSDPVGTKPPVDKTSQIIPLNGGANGSNIPAGAANEMLQQVAAFE